MEQQLKNKINLSLQKFRFSSMVRIEALPKDELLFFNQHITSVKLKKKQLLYNQGSAPHGVYILQKGKLKVYQLNYDGSIQILFVYSVGEIFGYRSLISNEYHPSSVAAMEDCELLYIEKKYFLELMEKSAFLSNQLLRSLAHDFTVLSNRINVFAQRGIKERLALALLVLNEKFQINANDVAEIKMTRTDLANYVGTSIENLTRTINFFREKNLIRTKGKSIFIENFEDLLILSATD